MAVKADGIKFLGHSRELNKVINETSELENKHKLVYIIYYNYTLSLYSYILCEY